MSLDLLLLETGFIVLQFAVVATLSIRGAAW